MSDSDKHFFWRAACLAGFIFVFMHLDYQQRRIKRLADSQAVVLKAVETVQRVLISTQQAVTNLQTAEIRDNLIWATWARTNK